LKKKQKKVEEISKLLAEEITPSLEKLRKERAHYMQWTANNTECERLERFCVAYEYMRNEEAVKNSAQELAALQEQSQTLKNSRTSSQDLLDKINKEIEKLTKQKEKEMEHVFKKSEAKVTDLSKTLVKCNSSLSHKRESLESEIQSLRNLEQSVIEAHRFIEDKKNELSIVKKESEKMESENKRLIELLAGLQRQFGLLSNGLSAVDTENDQTLNDQMIECERIVQNSITESKQLEIKIKHLYD